MESGQLGKTCTHALSVMDGFQPMMKIPIQSYSHGRYTQVVLQGKEHFVVPFTGSCYVYMQVVLL